MEYSEFEKYLNYAVTVYPGTWEVLYDEIEYGDPEETLSEDEISNRVDREIVLQLPALPEGVSWRDMEDLAEVLRHRPGLRMVLKGLNKEEA